MLYVGGTIMYAKVYGATIDGLDGVVVTVEVDISQGLPVFDIVGLPNQAVKESRERVRAAIKNSGFDFPMRRIVVNLGPAEVRKSSSGLDLPIAIGVLAASGQIKLRKAKLATVLQSSLFIGELSLDGNLKKTQGILSMAIKACDEKIQTIFTSLDNTSLLHHMGHITSYGAKTLTEIVRTVIHPEENTNSINECQKDNQIYLSMDYKDVQGQELAKRAMIIAATGVHHVMMTGSPGAGKTMLAERLPTILPDMSWEEQLETTRIHDVAGLLEKNTLIHQRPVRCPHHTATLSSIIGGGSNAKPGEITLAHNGVLFMDEAPEFPRFVLDALRQPLESHMITVNRLQNSYEYPANFICVLAANPCPCGYYGDMNKECVCSSTELMKYQNKISGPILDRIDLFISVERPSFDDMLYIHSESLSSADMKVLVELGRTVQLERFKECSFKTNGAMPHRAIRELCNIRDECWSLLSDVYERFYFTGRTFDRLLKVSRTIADMEGSFYVEKEHISEAMLYRYTPFHMSRIGDYDGATV